MEQEITMEGLVIQDLAEQVAALSVDKAGWRARALAAESQLQALKEETEDEDKDKEE